MWLWHVPWHVPLAVICEENNNNFFLAFHSSFQKFKMLARYEGCVMLLCNHKCNQWYTYLQCKFFHHCHITLIIITPQHHQAPPSSYCWVLEREVHTYILLLYLNWKSAKRINVLYYATFTHRVFGFLCCNSPDYEVASRQAYYWLP